MQAAVVRWQAGASVGLLIGTDDSETGALHVRLLPCMQEARNLYVSTFPRHTTTLARFRTLRSLTLVGAEKCMPAQVSHTSTLQANEASSCCINAS